MDDVVFYICFVLLLLFILLWKNKVKERELQEKTRVLEEEKEMKPISSPSRPSLKKQTKIQSIKPVACSYEVQKKKKKNFLSQGWVGKTSIKQAFILSEILKRKDEFER